jgi:hypothetical protein
MIAEKAADIILGHKPLPPEFVRIAEDTAANSNGAAAAQPAFRAFH